MAKIEVHTGNAYLDGTKLFLNGHGGERIPFVFDRTIPDFQWALFSDGRRVGHAHDIGEHVGSDVRRAVAKYTAKAHDAPATEETAKPADEPTSPVLCKHGGQIAWNL